MVPREFDSATTGALLSSTSQAQRSSAQDLAGSPRAAVVTDAFGGPLNYNKPGLPPNGDPRSPDIIVTPNVGVTYTGSASKLSEHGGFAHDDTNVILLVSNPAFEPRTVYSEVGTLQVAPTIIKALGLNPTSLDGVRLEGTPVLPDINFSLFNY